MADTDYSDFKFFQYNPSMAAAAIFVVLFIISTLLHAWQLVRHRTFYFVPFVIGGIFECGGYVGRAMAANETPNWTMTPYIMQSLLLLLAPALFAASIYMILGRLIRLVDGEHHAMIRSNWLTKVFVLGDVLSFLAQSAGGGMLAQAKSQDATKTGENIIIAGLVIQLLFFGFFMVVSAHFHMRITAVPTARSQVLQVPWKRFLWILYLVSLMIMVRSIFRVAEYVQGHHGPLMMTESYLYVFDATLMFLSMAVFNFFHPHKIISTRREDEGYLMSRA